MIHQPVKLKTKRKNALGDNIMKKKIRALIRVIILMIIIRNFRNTLAGSMSMSMVNLEICISSYWMEK